jgi:hypothetical protein
LKAVNLVLSFHAILLFQATLFAQAELDHVLGTVGFHPEGMLATTDEV